MFDVIVIGAGPSGLQASLSAKQAGLSVVLLEARNRVGGKVWSVPLASGRGSADLGAAWINDTLQKRVWKYVQQFGLRVVKQRLEGQAVVQFAPKGERLIFTNGHTPKVCRTRDLFSPSRDLTSCSSRPMSSKTWRKSEITFKNSHSKKVVRLGKKTVLPWTNTCENSAPLTILAV